MGSPKATTGHLRETKVGPTVHVMSTSVHLKVHSRKTKVYVHHTSP
jgi:hypothetical protein